MNHVFGLRSLAFVIVALATVSCGKKGPPLAPLVIVPAPVTDVSASRFGDQVIIRFTPPAKNADNSTPADLARIDVFALSVESPAEVPDPADIVREGTRVGSIDVTPPRSEEGSRPEPPTGARTFSETLTPEAHKVWKGAERRAGSKGPGGPTGSGAPVDPRATVFWVGPIGTVGSAGVAIGERPRQPLRLYAFVPVSGRGRRGSPTTVAVPLAEAPPAPAAPTASYTETTIDVKWEKVGAAAAYNVYERGVPGASTASTGSTVSPGSTGPSGSAGSGSTGSSGSVPLNSVPVKEPAYQDKRLEFGRTRCYSVTSVKIVASKPIESPMSDPACVTPADTFPPPAPTGLAAVAGPGTISLIWDAASAGDLEGYVVLRGDAPDGTLQALTPEPIKDTTYRDAAVTPGTRYAYVVVAVDKSKNRSAASAKVEETAR